MAGRQYQRGWRRWFYTWPAIGLLILFGLLLVRSTGQAWQKARRAEIERQQTAAELATLQQREDFLQSELAALRTESGVEAKIREKFPVVKLGEGVILVTAAPLATGTATTSQTWWQSLWSGKK